MTKLFSSSAATAQSVQIDGSGESVSTLVLDVVDEGSWSGTLVVAARMIGAAKDDGETAYTANLSILNRTSGAEIAGDTGITAAGIYQVNISGLEVRVEHTRSAGAVTVRAIPLIG